MSGNNKGVGVFTMRLSEDEKAVIKKYSKMLGINQMSVFIRMAVTEKINAIRKLSV